MKKISQLALFILLAGLVSTASALPFTFTASKDTNIHDHDSSSDPLGNVTYLVPFSSNGGYSVYSYIAFDLNSFKNSGLQASAVSLELFGFGSHSNPLPLSVYGLHESGNDNWLENSINITNAPGLQALSGDGNNPDGNNLNGIDSNVATQLFTGDIIYPRATVQNNNDSITFSDFSSFINNEFLTNDTDGLLTLVLLQETETSNNHAFTSIESGFNPGQSGTTSADYAPRLQITAVPVPAAVWLLGSGLLGLVSFRKKQKV